MRFSLHPRGYIRWSDCTLEYFVILNFVSYCVIGKADDGVHVLLPRSERNGDRDLLQHALSYVSIGGSFADVGLRFAGRGIASCIIGVPFAPSLFYMRFTLK